MDPLAASSDYGLSWARTGGAVQAGAVQGGAVQGGAVQGGAV